MAANGFDASVGTNVDIVGDTAAYGELDALTSQYNKETQAIGYEAQASNFNNQANLDIMAGQNAYKSGMTSAVGAGLNGLASVSGTVANNWYSGDSVGKILILKIKHQAELKVIISLLHKGINKCQYQKLKYSI